MEQNETKIPKKIPCFFCEKCEYKTGNKKDFTKHLTTPKHKNGTNETENETYYPKTNPNTCLCGASFQSRTTFWRHKKKCSMIHQDSSSTSLTIPTKSPEEVAVLTQMVLEVVKSNNEFQKQMFDLMKNGNMGGAGTNYSHNHTNSHNKTFNLQVYLNETCKDAMNITDFVNSLQIQLSDLEKVGKDGFVNGISSIIMKNLKALDYTQRPVHCSDQKRETMYVKDDDQWSKEDPDNQKLKKAIKQIAHKNICLIPEWKAKYPDCIYADSKKSDLYNHIMYEAMDNNVSNSEKIIKKIAKEVGITK